MKLKFNAPVTFSIALVATLVMAIDRFLAAGLIGSVFTAPGGNFEPTNAMHYVGILTYIFGHESWVHMWNNFLIIILLGPILEEKYDPKSFGIMILAATVVTALFNILLRQPPLVGSSALAFMMIMLVSFARSKPGDIPVSFILVFVLYLLSELTKATGGTGGGGSIAHIVGGICGVIFGFMKLGQSSPPPANVA